MAGRLERDEPHEIVQWIAQVGAVARRAAVRDDPHPREAEHVIDADAARVREGGAQQVDERREAVGAQRGGRPRRHAPRLAGRVEQVGRRAERHAAQQRRAVRPRVAARAIGADREIGDQPGRHARAARGVLRVAERARCAPLQERVERDRVGVLVRERLDFRRSRRAPRRRPLPPVRADPVLDAERLQRIEARMRVERRAARRAKPLVCVARRVVAGAPRVEARTQAAQLHRQHARPVDQQRVGRAGGRVMRAIGARHRVAVEIRDVVPAPRRRRIRAVVRGKRRITGVRRADCDGLRAVSRHLGDQPREGRVVARAVVAAAAQAVELGRDAPAAARVVRVRQGVERARPLRCDREPDALLADVERVIAGHRKGRQQAVLAGAANAAVDVPAGLERDPEARAGRRERRGQGERQPGVAGHEARRRRVPVGECRRAVDPLGRGAARPAERIDERGERDVVHPPRDAAGVGPVGFEAGRVCEYRDRDVGRHDPASPFAR
ncbi:hypothetical protein BSE24067_04149 [Burkholderia seminalis]|nr:hypothetical protein BSE24067_04149 [Burkholderia seminalis]